MITKKYYKILAELLGKAEDLEEFKERLIAFLAIDNPRFSIERFEKAIETARTQWEKERDACDLNGDTSKDCADCAYSPDYHYDTETGECVKR
jgi:hypothetical protein